MTSSYIPEELQDELNALRMTAEGWDEIHVEWAMQARRMVPSDFDFGHGCPSCTITRVLNHVEGRLAKLEVLDGSACAEEQAAGNGPCGACVTCLRIRLAKLEAVAEAAREVLAVDPDVSWEAEAEALVIVLDALDAQDEPTRRG